VRTVFFGAAAPVATATATGDVDVGATGITGTLFNLAAGGAKIWLVADRGQERPGYPLNAVVVPKASYEAGVRTLRTCGGSGWDSPPWAPPSTTRSPNSWSGSG
jgi:NitT/TauT family transport system substrate-binding protein